MILNSSQMMATPMASNGTTAKTVAAAAAHSINQDQPYQHKLNQVSLRTSNQQHKLHDSNEQQVRPGLTNRQHQELAQYDAKRRRSKSDLSRLSVILPTNNLESQQQQQQPGSSLETPITIHSDPAAINHPSQQLHPNSSLIVNSGASIGYGQSTALSSGCQLINSLMQFSDRVGSFTGLPSCTPTSADGLAASDNLRSINPFFLNVSPYTQQLTNNNNNNNKHICDNQVQKQLNDEPQSLPEDLSPSTKARLAVPASDSHNSSTNNNSTGPIRLEPLHMPSGTLMLSPFPFLLSPEHDAWLRLNYRNQQQLHPLAGKSASQQMPIFDELSYHHRNSQQQQQQNSSINQQQHQQQQLAGSTEAAAAAATANYHQQLIGVNGEKSASNLAQDLTNQQQQQFMIGQQPQQAIASTITTAIIANDPPPTISAAGKAGVASTQVVRAADKTTAQSKMISSATSSSLTAQSSSMPMSMSVGQQQLYQMQNNRLTNNSNICPASAYAIFPDTQQQQQQQLLSDPIPAMNNAADQQQRTVRLDHHQPAQRQIFIPVHQQQPIARSQAMQRIEQHQQRPLSAKQDSVCMFSAANNRPEDMQETSSCGYVEQASAIYGPQVRHPISVHQQSASIRYDQSPSLQQQQQQQQQQQSMQSEQQTGELSSGATKVQEECLNLEELKSNSNRIRDSRASGSFTERSLDDAHDKVEKDADCSMSNNQNNEMSSNSNSSSAFNCNSPIMTLSSGSSSARSSISRDTSTSIEVAMAITKHQQQVLNTSRLIIEEANNCNQTKNEQHQQQLLLMDKTKKKAQQTSRKMTTNSNKELDSLNGTTIDEMPVKKKSKGGRKKKQVTHEEMLARKSRSKERNRVAAKRCRQKRKQFIDDLCAKIDSINDLNRKLQKENAQLREELDRIKHERQM